MLSPFFLKDDADVDFKICLYNTIFSYNKCKSFILIGGVYENWRYKNC